MNAISTAVQFSCKTAALPSQNARISRLENFIVHSFFRPYELA
jgi:hypothetical protein